MTTFWEAANQLVQLNETFVVITLISCRGSAPQNVGAKALVTSKNLYWGTVGGGKVEAQALRYAQNNIAHLKINSVEIQIWNLQTDIGMSCGGEVTFLFELHIQNCWPIAIFGAGHVSQALIRTLLNLKCQITCIDSRPEWLEKLPKSEKLKIICTDDLASVVQDFHNQFYFLTITQGHSVDKPILEKIFKQFPEAPYVGGIGSKLKSLKLKNELKNSGISESILKKFNCPIGLELGTNDPYEIAISITAQLLQIRDQ